MAKRSDFERVGKDKYRTPRKAVLPLLPHLAKKTRFIEPCAGNGILIDHLRYYGHRPLGGFDIEPERGDIKFGDAMRLKWPNPADGIWITNPPWRRDWMHPILMNLLRQAPLWALFDADWMHNVQSIPFKPYLRKIVSVGRVEWMPGTGQTSKDNAAWYYFEGLWLDEPPKFYGPA